MFDLPTSLEVNGKMLPIRQRGDYRMVLDCFGALNDSELDDADRVLSSLIIFYEDLNSESDVAEILGDSTTEAVEKMFAFFSCNDYTAVRTQQYSLVDWEQDAQLIASAINETAKVEVRALEYLHWWTFMGYYTAIKDCLWASVVAIRFKIKAHKKLDKEEIIFKRENPQYFVWKATTVDDDDALEAVQQLWKFGGD